MHPRGKLDLQLSIPAKRNLNCTHRRKLLNPMSKKRVQPCRFSIECDLEEAGVKYPRGAASLTADVSGTPLLSKVACQSLQPVNVNIKENRATHVGFFC